MTTTRAWGALLLVALFLSGCGHKKKINALETELSAKEKQVQQLEEQLAYMQSTNTNLLDRMADLSVVSKTGAESIKESLQNINQQYGFIQDLTRKVQEKDSINLALVMNLKRSLDNIHDDDVRVEVRGGKVHVSISDKLLFPSGSTRLRPESDRVMKKLANVLNDHRELDILVEGHTDNVPISSGCLQDNWDLSVGRATEVVRTLSEQYYVAADRLTAAGRADYAPIANNDTEAGRRANRRTEIVITPRMEQFFELLQNPVVQD